MQGYERLLETIREAAGPQDAIDELLVRDVVDLTWDVLRFRRQKVALLKASEISGLGEVLAPLVDRSALPSLLKDWYAGDEAARETISQLLAKAGQDDETVLAHTLAVKLDPIERIERMIGNAEARRAVALRELDRRRESLAGRLRRAVDAEDAEFVEVARRSPSGTDP